jgi:two-component system, NarL family, response regulator DegU
VIVAKRILLVDDHRLVREGLRRTLEDAGYEVVGEADNGADGLDMAERLRPHVVLMDVSMPVVDGITATRRMRTRAPDAHVVVLTMHADSDLVDRARAAGAAGYLLKDASGQEVIRAIQRAIAGQRTISANIASAAAPPAGSDQKAAEDDTPTLTDREVQILQMLADGCSPAEVAERLFISPKTVRNHLTKVYDKLGVNSRSAAIVVGLQVGLIELPE